MASSTAISESSLLWLNGIELYKIFFILIFKLKVYKKSAQKLLAVENRFI